MAVNMYMLYVCLDRNEKDMLALIDELREKMNRLPSPPVIPVTGQ